ncbi:tripartite tricarboxylate transporter TctB family protein [Terribacillus saccharophilus]|uniref:tripartite tricarboxylate transporter TctB family protein n=1 Tax=Terribacillus saccharophilus TaxID=361277 RepID=UPI0039821542
MKNFKVWVGIVLLMFSVFIFYTSRQYSYYSEYGPGAGFFPAWLSGLLGLFSILFIIDSLRKGNHVSFADVLPPRKTLWKLLKVVLSILVFIFLSPFIGYVITSILVMFILLVPDFKWSTSLVTAVSVTLVLFFVFQTFLDVPLPNNPLGF